MTQSITADTNACWKMITDQLVDAKTDSDCIEMRTNVDGTLNFTPLPLAMKHIWLFNNGGEKNDVY